MPPLRLTERYPARRAFITGAGSGLGEALSVLLAADGWTIAINDQYPERVDACAAQVRERGGRPVPCPFDVRDREAFARAAQAFLAETGGVDLLINNVGVGDGGLIGAYALEDWDWLLDINLMGVVQGCHYFVNTFKAQRAGHIINVASAAAFAPVPRMSAYCASKAAVAMLSEVLFNELHEHGVQVSVVEPRFFRTRIHEHARGPERETARRFVEHARYTADEVAWHVLHEAGRGRFLILHPPRMKTLWRLRRLLPKTFMHLVRWDAERHRVSGKPL